MHLFQLAFAASRTSFGRGPARASEQAVEQGASLRSDLRLFAETFIAGFLFVSILIG